MDENKKEKELQNSADSGAEAPAETEASAEEVTEASAEETAETSAQELAEASETSAVQAEPEGGAPDKKNKRLRNALIRVGCALIAAAILLAVSKFSILDLKKGATKTDSAQNEEMGSFVKQDVTLLLGDLSDQGLSGNYMLAVSYDKIIVVHLTNRYIDNATAIKNDTLKFIDGEITTIDKYVTVEGTVEKQSEDLSGKAYAWFDANKSWMEEKGVISKDSDPATYLSDAVINVDTVNSMSETLVLILTGLAALLILYIIVELVLMACGVYLKEPKKKKALVGAVAEESDDKEAAGEDAQESAEKADEEVCENAEECIKGEEKPENNGSSEESEKKTETQEDK